MTARGASARARADYGIDAPGIRRGMFVAGFIGLAAAIGTTLFLPHTTMRRWLQAFGFLVAVYGFFMGGYMTYGSRVGKVRTRETLLDLAATLRPWSGGEMVLDVGCGRGLMMIGAARRLTTGQATGIDLWRREDQAGNSPDAARANACREGVIDRIRIDTGDARRLPYSDQSFDLVLSHWVVHNLPGATDRRLALDEMLRVLKPGCVLVVADIAHAAEYRAHLRSRGVIRLCTVMRRPEAALMGALSGGSYRPQALLGVRPADLQR